MSNVLIVDDNESLRLAYSSILTQAGHVVATASTVAEGLEYLKTNTPDVLLLDMLLPKVNGLGLLREYDVITAHPGVKVIAFSNLTEPEIEHEARGLGAKMYVTKSLTSPTELAAAVQNVLTMP